MSPPESICVVRLSAIGDVCHAVATVVALRDAFPDTRITWVIGAVEHRLVSDLPGIDFIVFDKRRGWRALLDVRRQIDSAFDVLLHMQLSFRANLLALCIPARRRLGYPRALSKELHSLAINERVDMPPRPHVLDSFQAFAQALGVPATSPAWPIPIPLAASQRAAELLPSPAPLLVITPAASAPERCWLATRYAALADHAVSRGWQVALTGGPAPFEAELASRVVANARQPISNLVGKTDLKTLLAILGQAQLVVAPDTGPAHMAVTQGTPVIGLYAHSNPDRTGPYFRREMTVSVYQQHIETQRGRPLAALPWGVRARGDWLMASIETAAVIDRFDAVADALQVDDGTGKLID